MNNSKDELAVATQKTDTLERVERNVKEFCRCVFEPNDIVEIRILPAAESSWCKASEMAGQAEKLKKENQAGQNIYVGINPRKQIGGTKTKDVALARCLFADFDNVTVDDVKQLLAEKGFLDPTIIVFSGHGCWAYWRLNEPIKDLTVWTRLQKRLIATLGSDKSVHDAPRIARLPGFTNHKDPPAEAYIVEADSNRRYLLADIEENLEEIPLEPIPTQQPTTKTTILEKTGRARLYAAKWEGIAEGRRNIEAFRHAAVLVHDFNLTEAEALPILQEWNAHNSPPLLENELLTALHNGSKYGSHPAGEKLAQPAAKRSSDNKEPENLQPEAQCKPAGYNRTEARNAERFNEQHSSIMLHCRKWDAWLLFDNRRWNRDIGTETANQLALKTARQIIDEARGLK